MQDIVKLAIKSLKKLKNSNLVYISLDTTVQMGLGNGSIMSGKKLVILEFKYLQNKKW